MLRFHEHEHALGRESSAGDVRRVLYNSSVGRWKHSLGAPDQAIVKDAIGDVLIELGYATDRDW